MTIDTRSRWWRRGALSVALVLLTACTPGAASPCIPGQSVDCACAGGGTGAQTCNAAGTGFDACSACTTDRDAGATDGDTPTAGDGGGSDGAVQAPDPCECSWAGAQELERPETGSLQLAAVDHSGSAWFHSWGSSGSAFARISGGTGLVEEVTFDLGEPFYSAFIIGVDLVGHLVMQVQLTEDPSTTSFAVAWVDPVTYSATSVAHLNSDGGWGAVIRGGTASRLWMTGDGRVVFAVHDWVDAPPAGMEVLCPPAAGVTRYDLVTFRYATSSGVSEPIQVVAGERCGQFWLGYARPYFRNTETQQEWTINDDGSTSPRRRPYLDGAPVGELALGPHGRSVERYFTKTIETGPSDSPQTFVVQEWGADGELLWESRVDYTNSGEGRTRSRGAPSLVVTSDGDVVVGVGMPERFYLDGETDDQGPTAYLFGFRGDSGARFFARSYNGIRMPRANAGDSFGTLIADSCGNVFAQERRYNLDLPDPSRQIFRKFGYDGTEIGDGTVAPPRTCDGPSSFSGTAGAPCGPANLSGKLVSGSRCSDGRCDPNTCTWTSRDRGTCGGFWEPDLPFCVCNSAVPIP